MALSGGHYDTLAEVLKLTLPTLIPGIVDENFKRGNPVDLLPFSQANHSGELIYWLRSGTDVEGNVANIAVGGQTVITEGATVSRKSAYLRSCYLYEKLDKFVQAIYGSINNYEEISLGEMMKGVTKKLGDKTIYDDYTYDDHSLEMDGLHSWAATNYGENWDIDEGEGALALNNMRILLEEMKYGLDFWLMPFLLQRQISRVYHEAGIANMKYDSAGPLGLISYTPNDVGGVTTLFGGKPIIPSDFLVAEQANTGYGSDARAKYSSGTRMYSIFAILARRGGLMVPDPGVGVAFGKTENDGEFFNYEYWDKHPDYLAKAHRLSCHTTLIPGSKWSIGRITDITNTVPTG